MENNTSSARTDRKLIERNRRNQMKALYSKLNSIVPRQQSSRGGTSLPDQLHEATKYIKKLQINLEKMKEKKDSLMEIQKPSNVRMNRGKVLGLKAPEIEIHQMGSALEVVLITGLDCQFMFNEVLRVLSEEGADIVNASYTVVQDTGFHIIHSKVEQSTNGPARITERLKRFMYGSGAL
ncbi:hypothetical protein L6164_036686 [Bauhinia variegata]|uniref:Uncharacterized protein n=1 Tax=Bauhinia variegata TaxID=167791 RepID=A0ACB9KHT3_BAUVA|nr:hypothetical protein L6164_036686 [Bauhinia variegata]